MRVCMEVRYHPVWFGQIIIAQRILTAEDLVWGGTIVKHVFYQTPMLPPIHRIYRHRTECGMEYHVRPNNLQSNILYGDSISSGP